MEKRRKLHFCARMFERTAHGDSPICDIPDDAPVFPQIGDTFVWPPRGVYSRTKGRFPRAAYLVIDRIFTADESEFPEMIVAIIVRRIASVEWEELV